MTTTIANTSTTSTTSSGSGIADQQMLAQNFTQFLTLLTAQLKNQDPTSPMDTNQFTAQLVQFASVEQQMKQNDSLTTLVTNTNSSNAIGALNFVGHSITASGTKTSLVTGSADWILNAPSAGTANITIADANGHAVYSTTQTMTGGQQSFHWNGQDASGVTQPDGQYTISVQGTTVNKSAMTIATQIYGKVDGVDLSGTTPALKLGSLSVPITSVQAIDSLPPG